MSLYNALHNTVEVVRVEPSGQLQGPLSPGLSELPFSSTPLTSL